MKTAAAVAFDLDGVNSGGTHRQRLPLARVTATMMVATAAAAGRIGMLASWRDDKSVAGRTTVLARWRYDESAAGRTTVLALWRANSRRQGGRLEEHPQCATIDTTINSVWSSGSRTACCRPREC